MSKPTRITVKTGDGEETFEIEEGQDVTLTFDEPVLVRVEASEGTDEIEAGDTTYEQDESACGDREVTQNLVQCVNCGNRYPNGYSRCQSCGTPNTH